MKASAKITETEAAKQAETAEQAQETEPVQTDAEETVVDRNISRNIIVALSELFVEIKAKDHASPATILSFINIARTLAEELFKGVNAMLSLVRVEHQENYSAVRSFNVALLGGFLTKDLYPEDEHFTEQVVLGGLLHDVGMNHKNIPKYILHKDILDSLDMEIIKHHTVWGEEFLTHSGICDPVILAAVRSHHENFDGSGYPDGLSGEDIPMSARIIAVGDVFDAMTAKRLRRKNLSSKDAVTRLMKSSSKFDPAVFRKMFLALGFYPPSSIVRLSDNSIGMVVRSGQENLLCPVVMIKKDPAGNPVSENVRIKLTDTSLRIVEYMGSVDKREL